MSGITSGTGIFSGIDTRTLIDQLLSIEARPRTLAQQRLVQLQTQQTAMLDLNTRIKALHDAAEAFGLNKIFQSAAATSSKPEVLTGTARLGAPPGAYTFLVDRLVSTHQQLSRGFADADATGANLTSITVESADGRLDRDTALSELNGGAGVARGRITLTDSSGATTTVDLARVGTVGEVLDAINGAAGVRVRARVEGDRLVVQDAAGGTGRLVIADGSGSTTATSLGIAGQADAVGSGGKVTGQQVNRVGGATRLSSLNDGNGVQVSSAAGTSSPDFTITTRSGESFSIDIGDIFDAEGKKTAGAVGDLQGVIDRIASQTGGKVTASIAPDGVSLRLADNTTPGGGSPVFRVQDLGGRTTAADLGIAGETTGGTISGRRLVAGLNSTLSRNLLGGGGALTSGEFEITARDGTQFDFSVDLAGSVADILGAIGTATGGKVVASLDETGTGIVLTDTTGSTSQGLVIKGNGASQLGLQTDDQGVTGPKASGNLQHRYISSATLLSSLNGGKGVGLGTFEIADSTGAKASVSVGSDVRTIGDLVDRINSRGLRVKARINDQGDGVVLEESIPSGESAGTIKMSVRDLSGTVGKALNLTGTARGLGAENTIDGSFERTVELAAGDALDDVVTKINEAGVGVTASVIRDGNSSQPFRLALTSRASGAAGRVTVLTTGASLGFTTLAEGRDARVFFGSSDPARGLLLTSATNTLDGAVPGVRIDLAGTSNDPVTLTVSSDSAAIESAVTRFVDAFNGLMARVGTVTSYDKETQRKGVLLGDGTVNALRDALYATVQSRAQGVSGRYQYLSQVGITIADKGVLKLDTEKLRAALQADPEAVASLFSAKATDPDAPTDNPVYTSLGVAEQLVRVADQLTDPVGGSLTRRNKGFNDAIKLQNDRITAFTARLDSRRQILERQFLAMEQAIAQLQTQGNALRNLSLNTGGNTSR